MVLAGVALLAAAMSLALTSGGSSGRSDLPQPTAGWHLALAGVRGPSGYGRQTACGVTLEASTEGVSHPVLPCGARVFISLGGKSVLTQVIDRGPYVPGRQFDLTEALAGRLGLQGVRQIRWAFARSG